MFGGGAGHSGFYSGQIRPPMELVWQFRAKGPIAASPAVGWGQVCFGDLDRRFYLLSVLDGRSQVSRNLTDRIQSLRLAGHRRGSRLLRQRDGG